MLDQVETLRIARHISRCVREVGDLVAKEINFKKATAPGYLIESLESLDS